MHVLSALFAPFPDELLHGNLAPAPGGGSTPPPIYGGIQPPPAGTPIGGGGVEMTRGDVTLGTRSEPHLYRGAVTALEGTEIGARVSDAGGASLILNARLQIDPRGAVAGTLSATAGGQG